MWLSEMWCMLEEVLWHEESSERKCLEMSILSFRLLCRYVEMTGVSFYTYWYGIYISVDSLRQASVKCTSYSAVLNRMV